MLNLFRRGTVTHIEPIAERMRHIRISGPQLRELGWVPGTHIRLRVGDPRRPRSFLQGFLRTYSIWDYSPEGHLDVCVLDHPNAGPGALWARRARIGDAAAFMGPEGRLVLREGAPYHLFVGDETAAVAFGAMMRALPSSAVVHGVILVGGPGGRLPVVRSDRLTWIHRPDELPAGVRSLDLPDEPGVAYVAGEARTGQAVRGHLVGERGWSRRDVVVKAFWAPGRRGMD
ncbi:siderophore-interacting protein [Sphaerisporangium dianthi]|uniref:Siderophore-interacting protein n=1 Tax=Sphaerisporangium dianthi TaxID=1436120 RepID=A0ABV9CQ25_9ACTN